MYVLLMLLVPRVFRTNLIHQYPTPWVHAAEPLSPCPCPCPFLRLKSQALDRNERFLLQGPFPCPLVSRSCWFALGIAIGRLALGRLALGRLALGLALAAQLL